jgi:hypothetical protein
MQSTVNNKNNVSDIYDKHVDSRYEDINSKSYLNKSYQYIYD